MAHQLVKRAELESKALVLNEKWKTLKKSRDEIELDVAQYRKQKLAPIEEKEKILLQDTMHVNKLIRDINWEIEHPYYTTIENLLQLRELTDLVCQFMSTRYCGTCQRMVPVSIGCLTCRGDKAFRFTVDNNFNYRTHGESIMYKGQITFQHENDIELAQEVDPRRDDMTLLYDYTMADRISQSYASPQTLPSNSIIIIQRNFGVYYVSIK